MEGPPLGPGGEDITWPDQVAPRGRKASSTRKIKPQTSNLLVPQAPSSRQCPPSLCPYLPFLLMTDLGALDVRHGVAAGTQRLSACCYQKVL